MRKVFAFAILCLVLALPSPGKAGWLTDAVNDAVENTGRRKVQEKVDEAADTADDKAHKVGEKSSGGDAQSPKKSKKPKASGAEGEAASNGDSATHTPSEDSSEKSSGGKAEVVSAQTDEKVFRNYDFVPGEKIIFFDDFSDTDVGEFPVKWTLEGPKPGNNGPVEVVQSGDKRFLRSQPCQGDWGQDSSTIYIRLKELNDLPKKFTVEFDAILGQLNNQTKYYGVLLVQDDADIADGQPGQVYFNDTGAISKNNNSSYEKDDGKLHHISIMVNGTFIKAYVDGERVINDPDGIPRPVTHVGMNLWPGGANRQDKLMFTNFRLAEGGKDIQKALETDGRIVTHGIQFDTGSDKIKPESYPTLKTIYDMLVGDPKLKFRIEGHTDNVGNAKSNQTLSEKRAASVMAWMTKKGLDPDRFKTAGFGDTKPLSGNDTAEGKANNRRVEFVKF